MKIYVERREIDALRSLVRKLDAAPEPTPEPTPEPAPEPTPEPTPEPPRSSSFEQFWGRGFALTHADANMHRSTRYGVKVRDDGTITWRVHIPSNARKQQIALFANGFSSSALSGIKVQEVGGPVLCEGTFGYLNGSLPTPGGDGPRFHIGLPGLDSAGIYEMQRFKSYDITLTLLYQGKPRAGEFRLIDWKFYPR